MDGLPQHQIPSANAKNNRRYEFELSQASFLRALYDEQSI